MMDLPNEYRLRLKVTLGGRLYMGLDEVERQLPNLRDRIVEIAVEDLSKLEHGSGMYWIGGQKVEIWYRSKLGGKNRKYGRPEDMPWGKWGSW